MRSWLATTIAASLITIAMITSVAFVQIVRERDRYRNERDRAEANLYDSLVSDVRAQMQGRDTGWWWQAMDDLHQAAAPRTEHRDAAGLRDLTIQCMGSEFPCLRVHATWPCHAGAVRAVALSPDVQLAASGGDDGSVRVWSLEDDKNVVVLPGKGRVTGVAWHPGGRFLAATSTDGQLRIWDLGSSTDGFPALVNRRRGRCVSKRGRQPTCHSATVAIGSPRAAPMAKFIRSVLPPMC